MILKNAGRQAGRPAGRIFSPAGLLACWPAIRSCLRAFVAFFGFGNAARLRRCQLEHAAHHETRQIQYDGTRIIWCRHCHHSYFRLLILVLGSWILDLGPLRATPPVPNGVNLVINETPAGFSNFTFYVWRRPPDSTNWLDAGLTTNRVFAITNVPAPDTLYGATALAMSNRIWRTLDIGIAGWEPDIRTTNRMLRITAPGGVRCETGQWIYVSLDLKTFTQMLKFHNPAPGVILVEHKVSTNTPGLFMAYPAPPPMPPLPGK